MFGMAGESCCCQAIGFDEAEWPGVMGCLPGKSSIINLKTNISRITECAVVFAGNNGTCANAVRFNSSDWPAIRQWIQGGGRLFIAGEHSGEKIGTFRCLSDMANYNAFLTAMGSTLFYIGLDYDDGFPLCSANYYSPGLANIAQGIGFPGERFGAMAGGTTVWLGPAGGSLSGAGIACVVAEKIGSGFLFASGDSNHQFCPGYCDFYDRLLNQATANVL